MDEITEDYKKIEELNSTILKKDYEWTPSQYFKFVKEINDFTTYVYKERKEFIVKHLVDKGASELENITVITSEPTYELRGSNSVWYVEKITIARTDELEKFKITSKDLTGLYETFHTKTIEYEIQISQLSAKQIFGRYKYTK